MAYNWTYKVILQGDAPLNHVKRSALFSMSKWWLGANCRDEACTLRMPCLQSNFLSLGFIRNLYIIFKFGFYPGFLPFFLGCSIQVLFCPFSLDIHLGSYFFGCFTFTKTAFQQSSAKLQIMQKIDQSQLLKIIQDSKSLKNHYWH
jgi:hypothetical protein